MDLDMKDVLQMVRQRAGVLDSEDTECRDLQLELPTRMRGIQILGVRVEDTTITGFRQLLEFVRWRESW